MAWNPLSGGLPAAAARSMADPAPSSRPAAPAGSPREQAARWLVMVQNGPLTDTERAAFRDWYRADRTHRSAWQQAERLGLTLNLIDPSATRYLTHAWRAPSRRQVLQGMGALLVGTPLLAATLHAEPWEEWTADVATDVGEQRRITLPDGGRLLLNTDTAIDVEYGSRWRAIRLLEGELRVRAAVTRDARPFILSTDHGVLMGTDYVVRQHDDATQVTALGAGLRVSPQRNDTATQDLAPGMSVRFGPTVVDAPMAADAGATAWVDGRLLARDTRLDVFLAELARYRSGVVRCAREAAGLRLTGDFALADTDAVLRALPQLLPVRVNANSAFWVSVRLA